MVILVGNEPSDLSSNQVKAVCILYSANTLGKGMNSTILSSVICNNKADWAL